MAKITKINRAAPAIRRRKRAAAYARVSKETERTMHSLSAQISYYNDLIQKNPEWEFAGVYSDEAITGTSADKRAGFQKLIEDCEAGMIDIVLTKSISRFARNTVDLLESVRHLKALGITVIFEKENIDSMTADGELMLTILASYAQEEVETMSQNIKWTISQKFRNGHLNGCCSFLGYRWDDDLKRLVVVPDEAKLVRRIFDMYLSGMAMRDIARTFRSEGIKTVRGNDYLNVTIRSVLTNITYTGNLLLQKTYSEDPITKKNRWNKGERTQYYAENTHEAIIDMDTYERTQEVILERRELGNYIYYGTYPFTQKIICGRCGTPYARARSYRKDKDYVNYSWACRKKKSKGRKACASKSIPELELIRIVCETLEWEKFNGDLFRETVDHILVIGDDRLDFHMTSGEIIEVKWERTLHTPKGRENAKRYCNSSSKESPF